MIVVIFEVEPADGQEDRYFDIASELQPLLKKIDGFISVERFRSVADPQRLLSLSFWRDEAAVADWRLLEKHRQAQSKGRTEVFRTYRLRVAEVTRDYGMAARTQAPADSAHHHKT